MEEDGSTQLRNTTSGKQDRFDGLPLPYKGDHYLHKGRVYSVHLVSRSKDTVFLQDIETKDLYETRLDTFHIGYERVLKVGELADLINRTPRSIYRYEQRGQIKKPKRYPAAGNYTLRFYTRDEILEVREMVAEIHQGRPREDFRVVNNDVPTEYEVIQKMKELYGL